MEQSTKHGKSPRILALVAATLALAACALAFPEAAQAETSHIAHSVGTAGNYDYYDTVGAAKAAGYAGATIFMDADWDLGEDSLEVADSKSLTIDMCGHKITSSNNAGTVYLNEHASLTLTSSTDPVEFTYKGYAKKNEGNIEDKEWEERTLTVTTSALITNTKRNNKKGRGINLEKDAKITLENVAVAGCGNGAIYMWQGSVANLTNVTVAHNMAYKDSDDTSRGAGVRMHDSAVLNLNGSHIYGNHVTDSGGAIYAQSGASIYLENGSTISGNAAGKAGGAVYFDKSFFTLKSSDGTAEMAGNACYSDTGDQSKRSGGAVHVDTSAGNNQGLIEGIAIKNNYSGYCGGGLVLHQRWTTVRNCTISNNTSNYSGGGVYVNGGNITFDSCSVTGNTCSLSGNDNDGGGIYVDYDYDLNLSGVCVVKNNSRAWDGADDVYLDAAWLSVSRAYIKGNLLKGSSVGVRTDHDGDLRVAKNFWHDTNDCLFSDTSGYYISYGTDEGGDAWQRHNSKEFTVKVNGNQVGRYRYGTSVTVTAPAAQDGEAFWFWSADKTTGLYPAGDYITDKAKYNSSLTFKMPQNDVDLGAVYANQVSAASITAYAPVIGASLNTNATLAPAGDSSASTEVPMTVAWYEVDENGEKTPAFGVAKKSTTYVACFTASGSSELACTFSDVISSGDVSVKFVSPLDESTSEGEVTSASVSPITGNLLVWATAEKTEDSEVDAFSKAFSIVMKNLGTAGSSEAATMALADGDEDADSDDVIDTVEVTCAYNSDTHEVAITAPHADGYNFFSWEDSDLSDEETINVPVSELASITTLAADYTPVATEVKVDMDAPTATNKLAETADDIEMTCYDGSSASFSELLGLEKGDFKVSWSPEPEDGIAGYSTTYTALVEICDAGDPDAGGGVEDVENVIARNAVVTCNGVRATSAGFAVVGDKLCLALALPPTAAVKVTSVGQPADVELTFEQAKAYAAEQAEHEDALCWPLPKTVGVTLEDGTVVDGDVTWSVPSGFDANATAAQKLHVSGTVTPATEYEVDTSGVSLSVTTTIKVAAPEAKKDEDEDKDKDQDQKKDEEKGDPKNDEKKDEQENGDKGKTDDSDDQNGTKPQAKPESQPVAKPEDPRLPATGDDSLSGIAVILVAAFVCIAAAVLLRRRQR